MISNPARNIETTPKPVPRPAPSAAELQGFDARLFGGHVLVSADGWAAVPEGLPLVVAAGFKSVATDTVPGLKLSSIVLPLSAS